MRTSSIIAEVLTSKGCELVTQVESYNLAPAVHVLKDMNCAVVAVVPRGRGFVVYAIVGVSAVLYPNIVVVVVVVAEKLDHVWIIASVEVEILVQTDFAGLANAIGGSRVVVGARTAEASEPHRQDGCQRLET